MTKRLPVEPAPGPLEDYVNSFDDLFSARAERRGFRRYLEGLLLPAERNKTLTVLANTEPVAGAQHRGAQSLHQRRPAGPRYRGVQGNRRQTEAQEVGPRVTEKDRGRAHVPHQKPRRRPGERGQERLPRQGDEEENVHERDAPHEAVYAVHEIEGVGEGHDPDHPHHREYRDPERPGSFREDLRWIEEQEDRGDQRLGRRLRAEVQIAEVVREPDAPDEGGGE